MVSVSLIKHHITLMKRWNKMIENIFLLQQCSSFWPNILYFALQVPRCHELERKVHLYVKSQINRDSWHLIKANKEIKRKMSSDCPYLVSRSLPQSRILDKRGQKGQENGCLMQHPLYLSTHLYFNLCAHTCVFVCDCHIALSVLSISITVAASAPQPREIYLAFH